MKVRGDSSRRVIYRCGPVAWLWRVFCIVGIMGGLLMAVPVVRGEDPRLLAIGAPLFLPALFFGLVMGARIECTDDGALWVTSLLFVTRSLVRSDLRRPWVRLYAYTRFNRVYAPRAWIPVRGGLPIYLDLRGEILDRRVLANVFGLPARILARPSGKPDAAAKR